MLLTDIDKNFKNQEIIDVQFFDLIKQHRENFVRITQITIYYKEHDLTRIMDI